MCGIAGQYCFDGRAPDRELLARMSEQLIHRGPDGVGTEIRGCTGLVHRRLAIIDDGLQPMTNEDKTLWLVFNGEIYNYIELREELIKKGHRFHSQSDTEVILHAYEEWGAGCLQRFNGMWAFALWDEKAQQLFCARDRSCRTRMPGKYRMMRYSAPISHGGCRTIRPGPCLTTYSS